MAARKDSATILVVDDEPLIRETLAEYLQQQGFHVVACESGESALVAARKTAFDIVICDINLPGLDGLEVQERLARISPETCIILITAYATVDTAVEAFQKGAAEYLMKPIILREVSEKIRRLIKQKAIAQENQWLRRELNVANTDIVVWHVFGLHHSVRPEDFPVQPVVTCGFKLMPSGFFDRNPMIDLPPTRNEASCCV